MQASVGKIEAVSHQAWAILEACREESNKIEAEKRKQDRIDAALKPIPLRFLNKTFANFLIECRAQAQIKNIIEHYAKSFLDRLKEGSCSIFSGFTGTGKTLLAFILYQHLVKQGFRVEYQPSLHFLRLLQEKQFESYHAFKNHLHYYEELPLLILDEVTEGCGKNAYPADWERHLLRVLIDVRYQVNRCTLIITNRSKKELIDRVGQPTIDRLSEKGVFLAFNWDSYRPRQR